MTKTMQSTACDVQRTLAELPLDWYPMLTAVNVVGGIHGNVAWYGMSPKPKYGFAKWAAFGLAWHDDHMDCIGNHVRSLSLRYYQPGLLEALQSFVRAAMIAHELRQQIKLVEVTALAIVRTGNITNSKRTLNILRQTYSRLIGDEQWQDGGHQTKSGVKSITSRNRKHRASKRSSRLRWPNGTARR